MKFALALLASILPSSFAVESISEVKADSKFGLDLLSRARKVEEAEEVDATWVSGYSLKFQGCHHIAQWNGDADEDEDVRIMTKRLARFRLCPSDSCSDTSGAGCKNSFGDYIIDMDLFLESYMANKQEVQEEACEYYSDANCSCENNGDDQFDEQACMNTCFENAEMSQCVEDDEIYYDANGNQVEKIDPNDYQECTAYNGRRRLEDNGAYNGDFYIGPYCSDDGGKIVLGAFTDDECTDMADQYGGNVAFKTAYGLSLPSDSLVDTSCYSCEEKNDNDNNGYYTKEACETVYENAGKCEADLENELGSSNVNNAACTYMEGIKTTRYNGIIISGASNANKVASAFIGMFTVSFVLLGSYVYYLKTKLDRGSVNLSD